MSTGKHKPSGTPELGLSPLAGVRADSEPVAPGRQGRQLPAELTLASWAFLSAAASPQQEVFSKLVGYPAAGVPAGPAMLV